ncbi:Fungal specific transcription factor [Exophiala sideris]|uniref:Fungal specific transcription factor n=1 Tax=Exophiala sideris TaxID=1016849 RepID=A0ABR0J7L2_9EURO|nr:Fungal specific transcription factor [Exophiala sideris]KAK5058259.1 Fungal specific transcription factor [Exophiala sideris]KAK5180188.1 Fungal specific transcription factor [Eurotiomycetes sp. CCFEE 6388]
MSRSYQPEPTFPGLPGSGSGTLSTMSSPASARVGDNGSATNSVIRPDRPCDACRRRKSRCVINPDSSACVMCQFHSQPCTFIEEAAPRRRKQTNPGDNSAGSMARPRRSDSDGNAPRRPSAGAGPVIVDDYANLSGESLLKKTLGLQNHRYAKYIGPTDEHDFALLDLRLYDDLRNEAPADLGSFRKVGPNEFFHQYADADSPSHAGEVEVLDRIERIVAPHGEALIRLYFRIVHPSFPILHKKVYLEKYGRTHREFSPPLLAAVYILALNWWSYSSELARSAKPDVAQLEDIAYNTLQDVSQRAKLSTVQAGLLLLQRPGSNQAWQLTSQLVAIGQDLGLHLDCTNWRIPSWEKGLRKRLAWALFMQDTWSALIYGRPPHISETNWAVQPVIGSDFPESAADEDEEEGSTEVEKGRTLFSAMIALTKMLAQVLEDLYSLKAETQVKNSYDTTKAILERAKPIQLKLRSWYADMPEALRMDATRVGKLSSVGYLHLAYFATEITLHRRILRSLSHNTDPYLIQICRSAAKARLISAMDFFNRLKPEHLQSFWYFASKFNFALIGTFAGLCFVTSVSHDEAEFYQRRLLEYRWTLRVSNKSAEFLEIASGILESAVGSLLKAADSIDSRGFSFPMLQPHAEDGDTSMEHQNFSPSAEFGYYDDQMEP